MLTLYKRHTKKCAEARKKDGAAGSETKLRADRGYRRCTCPIHAEGTLRIDGFVRKTTGEVKWPKAEERGGRTFAKLTATLGALENPRSNCRIMRASRRPRFGTSRARAPGWSRNKVQSRDARSLPRSPFEGISGRGSSIIGLWDGDGQESSGPRLSLTA
jgi:IS5 family transposase